MRKNGELDNTQVGNVSREGRKSAFLTVAQAGEILGISRGVAYQAAKRYRKTGGLEGLPVIKIGGCLRVPVAALERMAQTGIEEKEAS